MQGHYLNFVGSGTWQRTLGNTQTVFAAYLPDTTEFKKLPVASQTDRILFSSTCS